MKRRAFRALLMVLLAAVLMVGEAGGILPVLGAPVAFAEGQTAAQRPITKITLSKSSATLQPGKTLKLTTKRTPANTDENVVWESSDEQIATVSDVGLITAVADGTATITARSESGNIASKCVVVVKTVHVSSVKLNTKSVSVNLNKTYKLKATVSPSNATYKAVAWESSDPGIATVSDAGVVTAKAGGTAWITATTSNGKQATAKVTVKIVAVKTVKINKKTAALSPGGTIQLKATVSPSTASYKGVEWTSGDESIASVDQNGLVTAHALGQTGITATASNGKKFTCKVTVRYIKVSSVKLNKSSLTLGPTGTAKLNPTVAPSNAHDRGVIWASSNPAVALVDQQGNITATTQTGSAVITATALDGSGKKASCKVTVKITKVTSIKLNKTKATLNVNAAAALTAKVSPASAYDPTLVWTSSNPAVAKVDVDADTGVVTVTGVKEGTATITARAIDGSNKKATCKVTVKAIRVKTLSLSGEVSTALDIGATTTFTATVAPENATYKAVKWSSSNKKIAEVDEDSGTVKGVAAGLVTITATSDNGKIKATRQVRVLSGGKPTYRALVMGSYTTRKASGYMPFVNKNVDRMMAGTKNAGNYAPITGYRYLKSKTDVKSALSQTFSSTKDDDVSLIYLVTHGQNGHVTFEGGKKMTYLEFAALLKPIKGQIVVVVSACNSGSFISALKKSKPTDEMMSRINILVAAQNGVKCCGIKADTEAESADFFTQALLEGMGYAYHGGGSMSKLADANGDGKITVKELMGYTVSRTPEIINNYVSLSGTGKPFTGNRAQVPQVYMSNPNLVVFE